jgi:hypothetical protein
VTFGYLRTLLAVCVEQLILGHAYDEYYFGIKTGYDTSVKFWHDRWLHGQHPMELASTLYSLARRKNITVAEAIENRNWMKGLQRISNTDEINQFVGLWHMLHIIQITYSDDKIS